jgi:hypothetical protein
MGKKTLILGAIVLIIAISILIIPQIYGNKISEPHQTKIHSNLEHIDIESGRMTLTIIETGYTGLNNNLTILFADRNCDVYREMKFGRLPTQSATITKTISFKQLPHYIIPHPLFDNDTSEISIRIGALKLTNTSTPIRESNYKSVEMDYGACVNKNGI